MNIVRFVFNISHDYIHVSFCCFQKPFKVRGQAHPATFHIYMRLTKPPRKRKGIEEFYGISSF